MLLRGFARPVEAELIAGIDAIVAQAPFRHMVTPGGHQMSVAMTNCGSVGWVTDRSGYRYDGVDPESGTAVAGDAAVVSRAGRASGGRGGLRRLCAGCLPDQPLRARRAHVAASGQGRARFCSAPIVSVSLGLPAIFLFGGLQRSDKPRRFRLEHGDIVVWGGPSRLFFHGVAPLADGEHALLGRQRINLTFRKSALSAAGFRLPIAIPRSGLCFPARGGNDMSAAQTSRPTRGAAPIAPASISRSCSWCSRWAGPPT